MQATHTTLTKILYQNIGKYISKQILEYWYRWRIEYRKLAKYRWKNF